MISVTNQNENKLNFDISDFKVLFQKSDQSYNLRFNSLDQVFLGKEISISNAIIQKTMLYCFIEFGREYNDGFQNVGSVSLTLHPNEREIYIGLIWIEPEFRGNRVASIILSEIVFLAEQFSINLALHAIPFINPHVKPGTEDISNLKNFYRDYGFKENLIAGKLSECSLMERLSS